MFLDDGVAFARCFLESRAVQNLHRSPTIADETYNVDQIIKQLVSLSRNERKFCGAGLCAGARFKRGSSVEYFRLTQRRPTSARRTLGRAPSASDSVKWGSVGP
jgi:hypothetical protein